MPGPRAHLAGTLALLQAFHRLAGGHRHAEALFQLLDHPDALPERVDRHEHALKYDCYLARSDRGVAWGVAVADRWEPGALDGRIEAFARALGGSFRLDLLPGLRQVVAAPVTTLAVGFDAPDRPPRLKVYLQEDPWAAGVSTRAALEPHLPALAPGCSFPPWLEAHRAIGVVTWELMADGAVGLKVYLGGASPEEVVRGVPGDASALARAMREASPLAGTFYYLTVRLRPGAPPRVAVNKIYNPVQLGFTPGPPGLAAAWEDVRGLFRHAGRGQDLEGMLRAVLRPGLRVVPTATAIEEGGRSVDVYCGAWRTASAG